MLKTRELFAGLYALEDERVRQFLVIGEERARFLMRDLRTVVCWKRCVR